MLQKVLKIGMYTPVKNITFFTKNASFGQIPTENLPLLEKPKRGIFLAPDSVFLLSIFQKNDVFSNLRLKIMPLLEMRNSSFGKNTSEKTPLLEPDPLY